MATVTPASTTSDTSHQRNLIVDEILALNGALGAATVLAGSGTISTVSTNYVRLAPAAAVTGIILQAGTYHGQVIVVQNTSAAADTITFAASGTSNVADGASAVITGPSQKMFVWDSVTSLWYHN